METSSNGSFKGTDWLTLEIAIEVIGDMIGFYSQQLHLAIKDKADTETIASIEMSIKLLVDERRNCYNINSNQEVITKAFKVYAPKLRELSKKSL